MASKFSWSWPAFLNVSQPQTVWRQGWREAWREGWRESWRDAWCEAWRDSWSEGWSSPGIDLYGGDAASVRSSPDAENALELADLSERSVIALVGLAFEARIAAGPRRACPLPRP